MQTQREIEKCFKQLCSISTRLAMDKDSDDNINDHDDDDSGMQTAEAVTKKPAAKREKRSPLWQCFDDNTNHCSLPSKSNPNKTCNIVPPKGRATSSAWSHLRAHHPESTFITLQLLMLGLLQKTNLGQWLIC